MNSRIQSFFKIKDIFHSAPIKQKRVFTNWIVLTGTGSTGKSTLVAELKKHYGENIKLIFVDEEFRRHLAKVRSERNMSNEEYLRYIVSQEAFDEALKMRLEIEANLDPNELCILDRSLIDTLAYGIEFGNTISDEQKAMVQKHIATYFYKDVVHLGLAPLEDDNCRLLTSEAQREKSQRIFFHQYANAGYLPIRLGLFSADKMTSIRLRIEKMLPILEKRRKKIRTAQEPTPAVNNEISSTKLFLEMSDANKATNVELFLAEHSLKESKNALKR